MVMIKNDDYDDDKEEYDDDDDERPTLKNSSRTTKHCPHWRVDGRQKNKYDYEPADIEVIIINPPIINK